MASRTCLGKRDLALGCDLDVHASIPYQNDNMCKVKTAIATRCRFILKPSSQDDHNDRLGDTYVRKLLGC